LADIITLVLTVRDKDGDLVGVFIGVLGGLIDGDCGITIVCALLLPSTCVLPLVPSCSDFGGECFTFLADTLITDFWQAFPGLFFASFFVSFFDDTLFNLFGDLDSFLLMLLLCLVVLCWREEAKYMSKLDWERWRFFVVEGVGGDLKSLPSDDGDGLGNALDSPRENFWRNSSCV